MSYRSDPCDNGNYLNQAGKIFEILFTIMSYKNKMFKNEGECA